MTQSVLPSLTTNPQTRVAGETFWFHFPVNYKISFTDLTNAIQTAGLDPKLSRSLASTFAFNRAVIAMSRGKLRDRVEWSQDRVQIQVSARVIVPDGIDYQREATVTFDKATQTISCPDPVVKLEAEKQFNAALESRKTSDMANIIDRAIKPFINKTVFPMKGGVYFGLVSEKVFIDRIEVFVKTVGGSMTRWEIADGTPNNVTQVQTVVVDSFMETLMELQNHIGTVNSESRDDKVQNVRDTLTSLREKLLYNSKTVGDQLSILEDHLAYAETLLNRRKNLSPEDMSSPFSPDNDTDEEVTTSTNGFAYDNGLGVHPDDIEVTIGDLTTGSRTVVQKGKPQVM